MLKRSAVVGIAAVASIIVTATAALAESTYPVEATSGSATGGGSTAFTGASGVPFGLVMIASLLVVGTIALFAARRWGARLGG
jgi:hypothetical protein